MAWRVITYDANRTFVSVQQPRVRRRAARQRIYTGCDCLPHFYAHCFPLILAFGRVIVFFFFLLCDQFTQSDENKFISRLVSRQKRPGFSWTQTSRCLLHQSFRISSLSVYLMKPCRIFTFMLYKHRGQRLWCIFNQLFLRWFDGN